MGKINFSQKKNNMTEAKDKEILMTFAQTNPKWKKFSINILYFQ